MLRSYLKVRDHCPVCEEELHHHRADDGPAWLTIVIVGHVMIPLMYHAFVAYRPEPLILASSFCLGSVLMALWLLPRLKGFVVAFQWAKRMGGFGRTS